MDYNVDLFLNVCSVIGPIIYYTFTYFGMLTNQNKTKEFIEQVRYSWNSLKEKEELKIIHTHANIGRFYAIIGSSFSSPSNLLFQLKILLEFLLA
ncbi:uncharacterized protein LOC113003321 isoform X4 [Solenopsis invicta]|uniref:uncharacterized protein LOC113003321 isoform X4 n=1 Tax=Solenopsis invicta TaxID=13686 RepID=UPI00193D124C|nr:uncharacterized protein LOC113003321 isoform X4 [Solenopsis invicta]